MTALPQTQKMTVRHGRLMFNIAYTHQGSRYFHVSSESPTFADTLGVTNYVFFISQIPDIYVGAEGNITANKEQLALLDTISTAINQHVGYSI